MRPAFEERKRNADQLLNFYQQVIQVFIAKLEKEYRYRGPLSPEDIQTIQEVVKTRLNFRQYSLQTSKQLFEKYLGMREGSQFQKYMERREEEKEEKVKERTIYLVKEQEKMNVKEEYKDKEKKEEETKEKKKQAPSKSLKPQKPQPQEEDSDSFDDLELFQTEVNKGNIKIWKQKYDDEPLLKQPQSTLAQPELTPTVKSQPPSETMILHSFTTQPEVSHSASSEEEDEPDFSEMSAKHIGSALLGTFSPFQMRRKPKEEMILVELQNVFVKFVNCPVQNFFPRVMCELTKIEKEEVNHIFQK